MQKWIKSNKVYILLQADIHTTALGCVDAELLFS